MNPEITLNKGVSYCVEPSDEKTVENYEKVLTKFNEYSKRIKEKQKEHAESFSVSEIEFPKEIERLKKSINWSWILVYDDYLRGERSIQESIKNRIDTEFTQKSISFDDFEKNGDELKLYYNDLEFNYNIQKANDESIPVSQVEEFSVLRLEEKIAKDINNMLDDKVYSKWNITGTGTVKEKVEMKHKEKIFNIPKSEFFESISSSYVTSREVNELHYLINHSEFDVFKYYINPSILLYCIEKYDLSYKEAGDYIILSNSSKFMNDKIVSRMEKMASTDSFHLKEMEKLGKMKRNGKLSERDFESFLWSPQHSTLDESDIYELVRDGFDRKKNSVIDSEIHQGTKKYKPKLLNELRNNGII